MAANNGNNSNVAIMAIIMLIANDNNGKLM
jgi:hypothetical protein